jgi:hypothetical protein
MKTSTLLKALALTTALIFAVPALAKLPPLNDEQKAKAEEKKVKDAETAKKDTELLGKAQDKVAERYIKAMAEKGVVVKPTALPPPPTPTPAPAVVTPNGPGVGAAAKTATPAAGVATKPAVAATAKPVEAAKSTVPAKPAEIKK